MVERAADGLWRDPDRHRAAGGASLLNRRTGLGFKPGVLLSALAAALVIAGVVVWAGPSISEQFQQLLGSLPAAWDQVSDWLSGSSVGQFLEQRMENAQSGGGSPRPKARCHRCSAMSRGR
ncbi:hypothetical protein ACFSYD_01955 [Paracoccus aerius]